MISDQVVFLDALAGKPMIGLLQAWERRHKCFSTCVCRTISPFYHKFAIYQHFCLRHHSFTFFLLKQEWIWSAWKKGGELSERVFELWKNLWKAWTAQSSFVSSGLRRLWGSRQNCLQNFELFWGVISGREIMDRICAPRNNNDWGKVLFCACCSWLCLLWARPPNFVRLTFERDIKMWLIEFRGNGHRKRWEWVRYCCQRRYHTLQIELDTKITKEMNLPKREQIYNTSVFMKQEHD